MQETLELFQPVPKLQGKKEKTFALIIAYTLSYAYLFIALIVWWQTSWYIALSILLLAYIVTGIVSSKILHLYVPPKQHEFNYSPKDLAAWIVSFYRPTDTLDSN